MKTRKPRKSTKKPSILDTIAVDELIAGALIALGERPVGQYLNRWHDMPWIHFRAVDPVLITVLETLPRLAMGIPRWAEKQAARRVEMAYRGMR
jgi:hypothetical protein